jgi:hypothetical protein
MTRSNLVDACTGKSAGLAPRAPLGLDLSAVAVHDDAEIDNALAAVAHELESGIVVNSEAASQLAALVDGMDWSRLNPRDVARPTATC